MFRVFLKTCFWALPLMYTPSFANLPESFGLGAVSVGQAGAGVATFDDFSASYFNPAGLAYPYSHRSSIPQKKTDFGLVPTRQPSRLKTVTLREDAHQLSFSFLYQLPLLQVKQKNTSSLARSMAAEAKNMTGYGAMNIGGVFDLRRFMTTPYGIPIRLGIATSLLVDQNNLVKVTDASQELYAFKKVGRHVARPSIITSLAFQAWPERLSIGFGVQYLVNANANLKLDNLDQEKPSNQSEVEVKLKPAPLVGLTYRQPLLPKHTLLVGLSYRGKIQANADLEVLATLPINNLGVTSTTKAQILSFFTPDIFTLGTAYQYKNYVFMLDFEYQRWSTFSTGPTRMLFETDPRFNDIALFRIASKLPLVRAWRLSGRFGYAFVPSFTPDQTQASNYLDNHKHLLAFGLSQFIPRSNWVRKITKLDLSFQWQIWQMRQSTKTQALPLADGSNQPNYTYGGNVFIIHLGGSVYL